MYKIALVEDEDALRELLSLYLSREGWDVVAFDGIRAAWKQLEEETHLWVLDLMLPDGNGFEMLRAVKQHHPDVPVIMISARDQELDRVIGLEMGSDDYLAKPFLPQELVIRARKLMNLIYKNGNGRTSEIASTPPQQPSATVSPVASGTAAGAASPGPVAVSNGNGHSQTIIWDPYQIDPVRRCAWYMNELIDLTTKEFDLLLTFAQHKGQAFSREQLLYRVWGDDFVGSDRVVDDLVRRLRKKCPALRLETLYGYGYRAV